MDLIIVSWNVQGQFSLQQLLARMVENGWSMLIVLEPQQVTSRQMPSVASHDIYWENVGDQKIFVIVDKAYFTACATHTVTLVSGQRAAVVVDVTSTWGATYRILTAHAPFQNNDGSAARYQNEALKWAAKGDNAVDLILGDMNTYGTKVGSSTRSAFRNLSEGLKTSRGGAQLDKALLRNGYYGLPSDVYAMTIEQADIEVPEEDQFSGGERRSQRIGTKQSWLGGHKQADHKPMIVSLPGRLMHSAPSGSATTGMHGAQEIKDDGHCLYRCIAHILWGDQERWHDVRVQLASWCLANHAASPFLTELANLGQLATYCAIVRDTNAWGGEFELATLATINGLSITLLSPQGFANATYGTGATRATLQHTGTHFDVV